MQWTLQVALPVATQLVKHKHVYNWGIGIEYAADVY